MALAQMAQRFLGAANNNMGQESFYKYMKKATSGKMSVTLAYFTGAMCRYIKDISDEQVSEVRKCKKDGSDMPTISVKCQEDVQSIDANTLVYAQMPPAMDVGEDNNVLSAVEQAYRTAHPDCGPICGSSVPFALRWQVAHFTTLYSDTNCYSISPVSEAPCGTGWEAIHPRSVGGAACEVSGCVSGRRRRLCVGSNYGEHDYSV